MCRKLFAGIIFVDISGFTRITELASAGGHYGVELVTQVVNRHFDSVSAIVKPRGGEICKFGGDACLILFPCFAGTPMPNLSEIRDLILAACARSDAYFHRKFGINFSVHGALGAGEVDLNIVGRSEHHLDYYVSSEAVSSVYQLAEHALSGEILGDYDPGDFVRYQSSYVNLNLRTAPTADRFLPGSVKLKLQQDRAPAELRNSAVIFIKLTPKAGTDIRIQDYHDFYCKAQNIIYNHMGVINKIDFTDKGYIMLALFGVPFVYANDIERAFIAARRISLIYSDSIAVQIGVTYSNIYCGIIGSAKRWEYGIIGNAVNISARLMSFAEAGDICLSREIVPRLEGMFETQFVASTSVKGISEPLDIYRLVKELPQRWAQYRNLYRDCELMVAKSQLNDLTKFLASPDAHFCQISGPDGSGKSLIIWKICEHLMQADKPFELVCADPHAKNLRLEFFYISLRLHVGIEYFRRQFDTIIGWCQSHEIHFEPKLLWNNLFAPQGQSRQEAELVASILYDIVALIYQSCPVLVIDNYDRFDPESRALILRLIRKFLHDGKKVLLSSGSMLTDIGDYPQSAIELGEYTPEQSRAFILGRIPNISRKAAAELHRVSGGNPRFLYELVQHLISEFTAGSDLITDQIIEEMRHHGLIPDSLENLFLADYEKLETDCQSLIKYASIYGRPFTVEELIRIFEVQDPHAFLAALDRLCEMNILRPHGMIGDKLFDFANPLMQESIYRTILLSEKIDLHLSIARFYEALYTSEDTLLADII
ncbi:MAG: adenylate/guanylate cyclase domain-containing protein, partial [Candidatus Cloacimonadaceae bacterium]|nr:adenylate/guanylate cyclase domain-containing protein [Candidatus Cloacimonadaceae bacterium]